MNHWYTWSRLVFCGRWKYFFSDILDGTEQEIEMLKIIAEGLLRQQVNEFEEGHTLYLSITKLWSTIQLFDRCETMALIDHVWFGEDKESNSFETQFLDYSENLQTHFVVDFAVVFLYWISMIGVQKREVKCIWFFLIRHTGWRILEGVCIFNFFHVWIHEKEH